VHAQVTQVAGLRAEGQGADPGVDAVGAHDHVGCDHGAVGQLGPVAVDPVDRGAVADLDLIPERFAEHALEGGPHDADDPAVEGLREE
jgi:hypothetical protein